MRNRLSHQKLEIENGNKSEHRTIGRSNEMDLEDGGEFNIHN